MPARVLNGARIAEEIRNEVAEGVRRFQMAHGFPPGLAAVLIGDNPASAIYVRNKQRACQEVGIYTETFTLPTMASIQETLALIQRLNGDARFHGILVQLPLPPHLDERKVLEAIDPKKDIDGLHPFNAGRLLAGTPVFVPCTPAGIQELLLRSGYSPEGQHVVICGRSNIVGKPLAVLLMQKTKGANATVTLCHTGTRDLPAITRQADILVAAIGQPRFIKAYMVKPGAVVVDVGINRVPSPSQPGRSILVGDVDFEGVAERAEAITPVPGGVGPLTVAMLLVNTLKAARLAVHGEV
ncbi:MAG: bifunctional methylenetetrahydrofolate dehydrogenase/methenyltetrahydrofolate cyclohydrolase FolD [Dehalococcoidia bacterium]|nr:bifunctional methylenetetrahydrofolate dehydrogenase/methenyltetrahydrofolate cyclohydrolase FolD [Dehalococcoidia bacterium]MDW8119174.1 bifunctional methylenetetrahydrofolate dehydrogenase/methenyltetrahydrofolate cyclohydrolase FolD [Chloroflexota bacterium]